MGHHELTATPLTVGHAEKIEEFRREIAALDGSMIWYALAQWVERHPNEAALHGALARAAMERAQEWAGIPPHLRVVE